MLQDRLWYGYEGRLWSWYQMSDGMMMMTIYINRLNYPACLWGVMGWFHIFLMQHHELFIQNRKSSIHI